MAESKSWTDNYAFNTISLDTTVQTFPLLGLKVAESSLFCAYKSGVGIFNKDSGKQQKFLKENGLQCFALVENGKKLVTGGEDPNTKVNLEIGRLTCEIDLDVETGTIIASMEGHSKPIQCLFANDKAAFTGGSDDCLNLWDLRKNKCLKTIYPSGDVWTIIAYQNNLITVQALSHGIKIWDITKSQISKEFAVGGCLRSVELSSDKSKLVCGSTDKNGFGIISIYSTSTWELVVPPIRTLTEGGKTFEGVFNTFLDDSNLVCGAVNASTRDVGKIYLWDASNFKFKCTLKDPHGTPNGCMAVTSSQIYGVPGVKGQSGANSKKVVTYTFQ